MSDTEPSILAVRNLVAEQCSGEVNTEDPVKGIKQSSGMIDNAVALLRGIISGLHVVRSVVKTEGEVESDDECVENVIGFHAELQG